MCSLLLPQCVAERRTETAKKSGKTALWSATMSSEEKADAMSVVNGKVVLPFHARAGDGMTLTFTVWDEDLSKRTADVFLGMLHAVAARHCLLLSCHRCQS